MGIVLGNNAHTLLSANISSTDTTIYVQDTSSFPTLGVGDYFYCTIESTTGTFEIVKVTQINATNFIVTRAQEGTLAVPFNIGARVELRVTVQNLQDQITEYVDAATTTLVGGASSGFDTLGEIEDVVTALDASTDAAIASIEAELDTKAPLASPALTGNPTAPTPTQGDNDTSIATTAFVSTAVGAAVSDTAYNATSWDGVTTIAPSKNAVRDKFASVDADVTSRLVASNNLSDLVNAVTAQINLGVREVLTANRVYTYNPAGGADFTTLAAAVAAIAKLDTRDYTVTVNGPGSTTAVTERLIIPNQIGATSNEQYTPNVHFNLANCDFSTSSGSCVVVIGGSVKVTTKSLACTSGSEAAVQSVEHGVLHLSPGSFGACTTGHMQAANGQINLLDAYTIAGSAPYHIVSESANGYVALPDATITLTGTPAFSDAFIVAGEHGNVKSFFNTVFSGAATGKRFEVSGGGAISPHDPNDDLNTLLPGDVNGTIEVRSTTLYVENGSNKTSVTSTASAARTFTLPNESGTPALTARTISASGLATGGGDLSANRTITVTAASDAEARTGSSTSVALTPANLSGRARFRANKNADQTGISDITFTKVTFPIEQFDNASIFASSTATPPGNGAVALTAGVYITGTFAVGKTALLALYKNGGAVAYAPQVYATKADEHFAVINWLDTPNGTDTYEVYVYVDVDSGTATVKNDSRTFFFGHQV